MNWQYLSVERRGRVAVVRFQRGDGRNAMSRALIGELTAVARSFENDSETSAIVLTAEVLAQAQTHTCSQDLAPLAKAKNTSQIHLKALSIKR